MFNSIISKITNFVSVFFIIFYVHVGLAQIKSVEHLNDLFEKSLLSQADQVTLSSNKNPSSFYTELESSIDKAIIEDPSLLGSARLKASEVAEIYLQNGRLQEAMWALEKGGLYQYAEYLSQKIQEVLSTGQLKFKERIGQGVSGSFFGVINDHLEVVIKPRDQKLSVESEVWSFQIDRALGTNLVPTAIKRTENNVDYSLHLRILNAKQSGKNFRDQGYSDQHPDIYVLDFIIFNVDRHYQNSMFSDNGKLFAIDHGRVLGSDGSSAKPTYLFEEIMRQIIPSPYLQNHILNLDLDAFSEELAKYTSPQVIQSLIAQIKRLKDIFSNQKVAVSLRPTTTKERLSGKIEKQQKIIDLAELQKAQEQKKLEDLQKLSAKFLKEIATLDSELPVLPESKEYIKKNHNKLTENGHKFLDFIITANNLKVENHDAILLESLIRSYQNNKIGFRDFRRLYYEMLKINLSEKFVQITQSSYKTIAPVYKFFTDLELREKYTQANAEAPIVASNFLLLDKHLEKQFQCKFIYR
jgi:hypothetical protein